MDQTVRMIVASFPTESGASEALKFIKEANVKTGTAAVLKRADTGKLQIQETKDWGSGRSALVGAIAGTVLEPVGGTIVGAVAGGIAAALHDGGFPVEGLRQLGRGLAPNSSALVLLADGDAQRTMIEQRLLDAGGQIISGSVAAGVAATIEKELAA